MVKEVKVALTRGCLYSNDAVLRIAAGCNLRAMCNSQQGSLRRPIVAPKQAVSKGEALTRGTLFRVIVGAIVASPCWDSVGVDTAEGREDGKWRSSTGMSGEHESRHSITISNVSLYLGCWPVAADTRLAAARRAPLARTDQPADRTRQCFDGQIVTCLLCQKRAAHCILRQCIAFTSHPSM